MQVSLLVPDLPQSLAPASQKLTIELFLHAWFIRVHTQTSTHNSVRHKSFTVLVFHHLLSLSCLSHPIFTSALRSLEEVDMWGLRSFNVYISLLLFLLSWSTVIHFDVIYVCIYIYIYACGCVNICLQVFSFIVVHPFWSCCGCFAGQMHLNMPSRNGSSE